jgi:hypothetical protein
MDLLDRKVQYFDNGLIKQAIQYSTLIMDLLDRKVQYFDHGLIKQAIQYSTLVMDLLDSIVQYFNNNNNICHLADAFIQSDL